MSQDVVAWAQERREALQKRRETFEEPRWMDATRYGLRRSTRPLDASLFEKVANSGLPKGELKLMPDQEVWATQGRVSATKVDSIPLNVPGEPIVLLRFKGRLWVCDGHHRVARARKEGVELPAVVYDADLQVAKLHLANVKKHLDGEHDQKSHGRRKLYHGTGADRIESIKREGLKGGMSGVWGTPMRWRADNYTYFGSGDEAYVVEYTIPEGSERSSSKYDVLAGDIPPEDIVAIHRVTREDVGLSKHLEGEHDQKKHNPNRKKFGVIEGGKLDPLLGMDEETDPFASDVPEHIRGDKMKARRFALARDREDLDDDDISILDEAAFGPYSYDEETDDMLTRAPLWVREQSMTEDKVREGKRELASELGIDLPDDDDNVSFADFKNRIRKAHVDQDAVDEDNLTERDGIHHRTGGRWKHESPGRGLIRRLAKHLQGKHDQKTHGRRGPAQVATFDPPKFVTDAVEQWFAERGGEPPALDWHGIRQNHKSQMRVADAYDSMPMWDNDAVASYEAMVKETKEQFEYLTKKVGVKFEVSESDPYRNVGELVSDLAENKRLKVLSTKSTGGHPYFSDEDNDKFRFVHDFFGHVATGRDFDRHGEEAAYLHHAAMFSDDARPAMTTETRGQNASLIKNREFPEQKVALLPEEFSKHLDKTDQDHDQSSHGKKGSGQPKQGGDRSAPDKKKMAITRLANKFGFENDDKLSGAEKMVLIYGGAWLSMLALGQVGRIYDAKRLQKVGTKSELGGLKTITDTMDDADVTSAFSHNMNVIALDGGHGINLSNQPQYIMGAIGEHPSSAKMVHEVQQWSGGSELLQQYVVDGKYGTSRGKDLLLDALSSAPTTDVDLYRGINVSSTATWRGLTGDTGKRALDMLAEKGAEFDLPPSSFSVDPKVARHFAETSGTGQRVKMTVRGNKKAMSIHPLSTVFAHEKEWMAAGRFRVVDSTLDADGIMQVIVEQVAALSTAGGVVKRWEDDELELAKHMLGRHDQKLHGRRHHDMMRFTRDVLGSEVQWSKDTFYNPSGDTMMSMLGNPTATSFKYKTSKKHPGVALLWNDDTKDAVLLSRDRSGRSKLRTLSGPERLFQRGRLLYGNYQAAKETGEALASDIDRLLPPEFKQAIKAVSQEAQASIIARHARRKESNIHKAVEGLLVKHLEGEHDQQRHDPTKGRGQYPSGPDDDSYAAQRFAKVMGLFGVDDLDELFPGGVVLTTVPWPAAAKRKKGKPFDLEVVRNKLLKPPRLDEVDPRWLHAFQPNIHRPGVAYYLSDEWEKTGETYADKGNAGNRNPLVYEREDGQNIILAGHHRAAAALLKGKELLALKVKGPWG